MTTLQQVKAPPTPNSNSSSAPSVKQYDAVVIGAGLGGLSAAGYLAKAGKRVLVLEHHAVPGGYAHEFRRGHFRFDVSLHALEGVGPTGYVSELVRDLGIADEVEFKSLDPVYTARFPNSEDIVGYADWERYEAELIRHFPSEERGIRNLMKAMLADYDDTSSYLKELSSGQIMNMMLLPQKYPTMIANTSLTWDAFMRQYVSEPRLMTALSTLWGYFGLPPELLSAHVMIFSIVSYHKYGAYYPVGGSQGVARAIEKTIKANGGEILYRQTVKKIHLKNGRATAVETEQGLHIETKIVVSNASAPTTMLEMVGAEHLPPAYANKLRQLKPSVATISLYLGLNGPLPQDGWHDHQMFIFSKWDFDDSVELFETANYGKVGLALTHYNHADPSCSRGGAVLSLCTLASWTSQNVWGTGGDLTNYRKNPAYIAAKDRAAEGILTMVDKVLPCVRNMIEVCEVGTPLTNVRYTRNPSGAVYGFESTPDSIMSRPTSQSPIVNLFMAGAYVSAGGQSSALNSGRFAAQIALSYFKQLASASAPSVSAAKQPKRLPEGVLTPLNAGQPLSFAALKQPTVMLVLDAQPAQMAEAQKAMQIVAQKYPAQKAALNLVYLFDLNHAQSDRVSQEQVLTAAHLNGAHGTRHTAYCVPDWQGETIKQLALEPGVGMTVVVANAGGQVVGVYRGGNPGLAALALLLKHV